MPVLIPGPGFSIKLCMRARVKNDSETSSSLPVFVPVRGFCHAILVQHIDIPARPQSHGSTQNHPRDVRMCECGLCGKAL